jgi:hypothetical protein
LQTELTAWAKFSQAKIETAGFDRKPRAEGEAALAKARRDLTVSREPKAKRRWLKHGGI